LRYGPPENSVVLKELVSKYNLTFLDFQVDVGVFATLDTITLSIVGIFLVPTVYDPILANMDLTRVERPYRPSRDLPRPREDTAEL
jgi:hypothetical protein